MARLRFTDHQRVEECLAQRAEVIEGIARTLAAGRPDEGELNLLSQSLHEGNALLEIWRGERDAIHKELIQRQAESQFLKADPAGAGPRSTVKSGRG